MRGSTFIALGAGLLALTGYAVAQAAASPPQASNGTAPPAVKPAVSNASGAARFGTWRAGADPVFVDADDNMAKDPSVFFARGQYYMFYTGALPGFQGPGADWQLEYATSADGVNWRKGGILFKADRDTWEAGRVQAPSRAIWHDGKYYMFYAGGPRRPRNLTYIGFATSTDLIHWTKAGTIKQNVERANDIFIYQEGRSFYMFYTTYSPDGHEPIFMRRSTDLKNWSTPEPTGAEGEGTVVWKEGKTFYLLGARAIRARGRPIISIPQPGSVGSSRTGRSR